MRRCQIGKRFTLLNAFGGIIGKIPSLAYRNPRAADRSGNAEPIGLELIQQTDPLAELLFINADQLLPESLLSTGKLITTCLTAGLYTVIGALCSLTLALKRFSGFNPQRLKRFGEAG